jgi:hypothetical protein
MNKVESIYGIKTSLTDPSPETKLTIRKDKASLYGLSVRDIAVTTQVALKGYVATKFKQKEAEEDVDIRVRLRKQDRNDLNTIRWLLVHSPLGMDIPMADLAYLTRGRGPTEIKRVDQQRCIVITANFYKKNFEDVIKGVEAVVNELLEKLKRSKKQDYSVELTGEQQRMKESFASLAFALVLAIVLVYMIMAAEFESFWQPVLIMFTVPLSLIGVAFSLFITRTPLSVVAYLGIIMLGGIAVNNGIVLIEFVNALRKEGYSAIDAVTEASKTRLRPILMTSLTTILGLVPLALGIGEGAELQAPLALTVLGGLTSATFLTLVFIPALYVIIEEKFPFLDRIEKVFKSSSETTTPERVESLENTAVQAAEEAQNAQQAQDIEKNATISELTQQLQEERIRFGVAVNEKEREIERIKQQLREEEKYSGIVSEKEKEIGLVKDQLRFLQERYDISLADQTNELDTMRKAIKEKTALLESISTKLQNEKQNIEIIASDKDQQLRINSQYLEQERAKLTQLTRQMQEQHENFKVMIADREKQLQTAQNQLLEKETDLTQIVKKLKAETTDKPIAATPQETGPLNPRQKELLEKLITIKRITRKEYAQLFNISTPTAARDLKDLLDLNLLTGKGPLGPGRWYELTSKQ